MPPDKKFDLGGYIEVKDRIAKFYELFGQGRLVTGEVRLTNEPDGVPRVMVQGLAYRSPEDTHPGVGWSWMALPGTTSYTKGSELENTETSAWGRAIGSLGILIDGSIATAQEVENKKGEAPRDANGAAPPVIEPNVETEEMLGDFSASGMVRVGTAPGYKLEPRQGPDGHVIGFRMEFRDAKTIPQVLVEGHAGEALFLLTAGNPGALVDTRLTVTKGRLYEVRRPGSRGYKRLRVLAWENHEGKFPMEDALPEPPPDIPLAGENEAETAPLFDDVAVA